MAMLHSETREARFIKVLWIFVSVLFDRLAKRMSNNQ